MMDLLRSLTAVVTSNEKEKELYAVLNDSIDTAHVDIHREPSCGALICHKPGKGAPIILNACLKNAGFMVSTKNKEYSCCITPIETRKIESLVDQPLYYQGTLCGFLRPENFETLKEGEKKSVEEHLRFYALKDEDSEHKVPVTHPLKGDICYLSTDIICKGNYLYSNYASHIISVYTLIQLISATLLCDKDLYFTLSCSETDELAAVCSLLKRVHPAAFIRIYGVLATDALVCGKGPGILFKDCNALPDRRLRQLLMDTATREYSETQAYLGNHSRRSEELSMIEGGVPYGGLCIPVSYMNHCHECICNKDVAQTQNLLLKTIEGL